MTGPDARPAAPESGPPARRLGPSRDALVSVVSGKGGVGKTNLVANLAVAAAGLGARVLVVDGDLGLANLDVLLGLSARRNVEDLLLGRSTLEQTVSRGPRGVHLLPAASGRTDLAALPDVHLDRLVALLRDAAPRYELILLDAGAGVGPTAMGLAARSSRALVVTTREPTSLADAYAAIKVLARGAPWLPLELLVNGAPDEIRARATHARLARLARRFLDVPLGFRGHLCRDPRLAEAVARQAAVVQLFPSAPSSRQLVGLARGLLRELADFPRRVSPRTRRGAPSCTRN